MRMNKPGDEWHDMFAALVEHVPYVRLVRDSLEAGHFWIQADFPVARDPGTVISQETVHVSVGCIVMAASFLATRFPGRATMVRNFSRVLVKDIG